MVEMEAELKILQAQQKSLAEDMGEIKSSLASIANSLGSLAVLEQKHVEARDGIVRAHKRIDEIQALIKDEVKGHERRIQALELQIAKNAWIERVVMIIVMTVIGAWAKGIF